MQFSFIWSSIMPGPYILNVRNRFGRNTFHNQFFRLKITLCILITFSTKNINVLYSFIYFSQCPFFNWEFRYISSDVALGNVVSEPIYENVPLPWTGEASTAQVDKNGVENQSSRGSSVQSTTNKNHVVVQQNNVAAVVNNSCSTAPSTTLENNVVYTTAAGTGRNLLEPGSAASNRYYSSSANKSTVSGNSSTTASSYDSGKITPGHSVTPSTGI